jgi:hypothetical protein
MIIVTGVDGSGTSAIVKALDTLGVGFPGPFPMESNHENSGPRKINETLLQGLTGRRWGKFPDYDKLANYPTTVTAGISKKLNWKDPRACITLPIWREHRPNVVWIKRSPHATTKTLLAGVYPKLGLTTLEKCYYYIANAEGYLFYSLAMFEIPFVVTCYEEWWKAKNIEEAARVVAFCDGTASDDTIKAALDAMRTPKNG